MAIGVNYKTLADIRPVGSEAVISDFFDFPGPPAAGTVTYRIIELPLDVITAPSITDSIYVREVHPITHVPLGPVFTPVYAPTLPTAGEFQIDAAVTFVIGTILFNQMDGGKTLEIICTGRGSLVFAEDVNDPRDELKDSRDTYSDLDARLDAIVSGVALLPGSVKPVHISTTITDNFTFPNNVTVNGDLKVTGSFTNVETETVRIFDNIIELNSNVTGAPTEDAGIEVNRGTSPDVYMLWRESDDSWNFVSSTGTDIFKVYDAGGAAFSAYIDVNGISAPGLSPAGDGRLYFDSTSNTLKLSQNGGAFFDVLTSSSGITGSGLAGQVTFFTGTTTVTGDNLLYWDNTAKSLGVGTNAPDASARIDVTSTTTGFLGPRMTTLQRDAIASPAQGLLIYNTTTNQYEYYDGTTWFAVGTGAGAGSSEFEEFTAVDGQTVVTTSESFAGETPKVYRNGQLQRLGALQDYTTDGSNNITFNVPLAAVEWVAVAWTTSTVVSTTIPSWTKFTVDYTDFSIAATSNDVHLFALPPGGIVHGVKIKHSPAFSGGSLSEYRISVGIASNLSKYASAYDVFQAVSDTEMDLSDGLFTENHGASVSVRAEATSVGANLSAATAGVAEIWVLTSVAL
jgi:hypothetical protein